MATLAVVGAGPGLGAAVARRFGREGFAIALIATESVSAVTGLQKADLLIALGTRFDDRVTGALDSFAPDPGWQSPPGLLPH